MSFDPVSRFHVIVCRYCGQEFKRRSGRWGYCSDQCYIKAHPRKAPRYPRWSHQEIRTLRSLAGEVSPDVIAERLGRTRIAVVARARMLSISLALYGERHPAAKYSDAIVEQARALYDLGLTPKTIAERLGVPRHAVKEFVYYKSRLGPCPKRYC
ncbi:MAG TPA: hypothetical protein VFU22_25000 [Roseiflexaceae bacterium]|nr:hypothetical protein [Roseiflexaceae bacterium]